jgi:hypothetical protein
MSTPTTEHPPSPASPHSPTGSERRVRHQAQDVLAVMAFSGALSVACAVALMVLTQLGR